MFYINHLNPLHLEVDIIINPVLKLKRLHLRTTWVTHRASSGTRSQRQGCLTVKAMQVTTALQVSLPGWPVSERVLPASPLRDFLGSQEAAVPVLLCVCCLITATSHTEEPLHFPGKRSSVSLGASAVLLGSASFSHCPPRCLLLTLLFPGLLHSNAWLCRLVFF